MIPTTHNREPSRTHEHSPDQPPKASGHQPSPRSMRSTLDSCADALVQAMVNARSF